jgi:hypothetical protein
MALFAQEWSLGKKENSSLALVHLNNLPLPSSEAWRTVVTKLQFLFIDQTGSNRLQCKE